MDFIYKQLNYMQIGSFFIAKFSQTAGITTIILKQWNAPWYLYFLIPMIIIVIFNILGWISVITGIWKGYMKEQFKGSLIEK